MSNIELNVVALGNFKGLESELASLQAQINSMNASLASGNASLTAKQMTGLSNAFHQSMMASGQFTSKLVSMSTAAQHLGERLQKSKTNMADYRNAMKKISDQSNIYNQLAQRQVGMQQAIVQSMGNGMARVYAQHNVDLSEASVRSKVFTQAIIAQNTALMQGSTKIINWGKNMQWAGRQLTAGLTMPVTLFAGALAKMYNEVDANLTRLSRVYGVGLEKPTQAMLNGVRKDVVGLAKELGHELGISATEVTDTAAQFAAAGLTGEQLISATKQASRLVVLGETDKQEAIKATIALQTAYKLNTEETTNAVNFFNAAQAATSTSMTDLVEAIPRVGPIIEGLGGSYKDMVAILTALKEGGVPAGEAANAIKNSLGRIINPTKAAQASLKGFGIDINAIVNKNAGNLIGTLTDLQTGLDTLSSLDRQRAISELFGKFQFARMAAFMDNFNKTGSQSAKVVEMMGMSASELAGIAEDQTKQIQQSASGRFKIAIEDLKNSLLPMGESALNMFTKLIEKVQGFFETINNLPGPIKSFLKIMGGLAIITGPVIMLVGLFGNLLGQVSKGVVNLRTFGMALANIQNGVNPLTILGKKFQMTTEEMIAETNAAKIFGSTMESNISPINAVTTAIEQLIIAMKELNTTSLAAATQKVQSGASALGAANASAYSSAMNRAKKTSSGNIERVEASHLTSKANESGLFKGIDVNQGFTTGNALKAGSNSSILNRAMTGTVLIETNSALSEIQGNLSQSSFLVKDANAKLSAWDDIISKSTVAQEKVAQGIMTESEIVNSLVMTWEETLMLEETYQMALKEINKNTALGAELKAIMNNKSLSANDMMTQTTALLGSNSAIQKRINASVQRKLAKITTEEQLVAELNKYAKTEVKLAQSGTLSSADRFRTVRLITQGYLTELGVIQNSGMTDVQIANAKKELEVALEEQIAAVNQGTISEKAGNRSRIASRLSGSGLAMGIGMGASMAGGMMMGSENKAIATAGSGLMFGGMAASMAPMLGMSGPQGLALGAAVALAVAMKKVYDESERLRKGMLQTFSISDVAAKQFGVTIRNIGDVQLEHLIGKSDEAKDAVSQLAKAYGEAEGKTKDYIDSIRNLDSADEISKRMVEKFYTDLASGLSVEQAKQDIAAILRQAGKEDYSIDIKLKIDELGTIGGPVDAFKKSISDITNNQGFTQVQSLRNQRDALRMQWSNDPGNTELARQITQLDNQMAALTQSVVTDSEALSTAIRNAFDTMSIDDFRQSMLDIGPAFTENEPAIQSFINNFEEANPKLAGIINELHNQGAAWADVLTAAQLVADGIITSIEEMRLAAKEPLVLDYYINMHETKIEETIMSNQRKGIAASLKGSAVGSGGSSSGGGGSGSSKAIDAQIEKNKELIDLIKKQMEERKKLIDLQNKELDFAKTKMGLENQIRDALAEGNFLKAAELQQQLKVEEAKKSEEDTQRALDEADQKRIDELEAKNKALEKKKSSGKSGGGSSSTGEKSVNGTTIESVSTALEDFSKKMAGSTLEQFLNTNEVKDYISQLEKLGVPFDKAKQAAIDYHSVARTGLYALGSDYEKVHKTVFDNLMAESTTFATQQQEAKDKIQQSIEDIVMNPMWGETEKIDQLSKYLVTSLKMGPEQAKEAAKKYFDLYNTEKVSLDALAKIENGYKNISDAARAAMLKQRAVALMARNDKLSVDQAMAAALAESREHGGKADGGLIRGIGGPTDDKIPTMLSNGEYVIKASSVSKYGEAVMDSINNGTFNLSSASAPTFNIPGMAKDISSASSVNNATINAEFNISGGDAHEIAQEVMNKLKISMKKSGSVNRF